MGRLGAVGLFGFRALGLRGWVFGVSGLGVRV